MFSYILNKYIFQFKYRSNLLILTRLKHQEQD